MFQKRYVILEHDWNGIHHDLMLEEDGVLKTWRLSKMLQPGMQVGEALPDHRMHYLDYIGSVTGDRGVVRQVEKGTYVVLESEPSWLISQLSGTLNGRLELVHQNEKTWRVDWTPGS